jgi:uncharacterized SAM-binding protein YcdF (DUF218 family)
MDNLLPSFVNRFWTIFIIILCIFLISIYFTSNQILIEVGSFLITDEKPVQSDAVVVLYTGVDYYPRLMEAAKLYKKGYAKKIIINGNRKTEELRSIERKGFVRKCSWDDEYVRILNLLGVQSKDIISISAEDVYDTVSESLYVGKIIIDMGIKKIILTTSKFHTKRASFIWNNEHKEKLSLTSVSAKADPFLENGWWKHGRQIRWVLTEYGSWLYYYWKKIKEIQ